VFTSLAQFEVRPSGKQQICIGFLLCGFVGVEMNIFLPNSQFPVVYL
jgi:hypothetical protein